MWRHVRSWRKPTLSHRTAIQVLTDAVEKGLVKIAEQ
jgi:hypothetical protein